MQAFKTVLAIAATLVLWSAHARAEDLSGYDGAGLFKRFCASCHGPSGQGDGPVAPALAVMVPDITRIAMRRGGTFPTEDVRRIIDGRAVHLAHGTRTMPIWGFEFGVASAAAAPNAPSPEELVNRLVEYLRSIQVKSPGGL